MTLKNRLAQLEKHSDPARRTWKDFISLDGPAWEQARKDNPEMAARWDALEVEHNRCMDTFAAALAEIAGDTVNRADAQQALRNLQP